MLTDIGRIQTRIGLLCKLNQRQLLTSRLGKRTTPSVRYEEICFKFQIIVLIFEKLVEYNRKVIRKKTLTSLTLNEKSY